MEAFSADLPNSTSLTFLVSNPQVAEKLASLLTNKITQLKQSKIEEITPEGAQKKWKITFSGKPSEDSYGR